MAIIFIECSKTTTPSLVLTKYLKSHYEDVFKKINHETNNINYMSQLHNNNINTIRKSYVIDTNEVYMGEPWDDILKWMDDNDDWNIINGINFVQFIDCLAKCGILAYTSSKFDDALPTAEDKIYHFFSAHLKLLGDGNGAIWKTKVETRLNITKNKIKKLVNFKNIK